MAGRAATDARQCVVRAGADRDATPPIWRLPNTERQSTARARPTSTSRWPSQRMIDPRAPAAADRRSRADDRAAAWRIARRRADPAARERTTPRAHAGRRPDCRSRIAAWRRDRRQRPRPGPPAVANQDRTAAAWPLAVATPEVHRRHGAARTSQRSNSTAPQSAPAQRVADRSGADAMAPIAAPRLVDAGEPTGARARRTRQRRFAPRAHDWNAAARTAARCVDGPALEPAPLTDLEPGGGGREAALSRGAGGASPGLRGAGGPRGGRGASSRSRS